MIVLKPSLFVQNGKTKPLVLGLNKRFFEVAEGGFEPPDLRVMSYILLLLIFLGSAKNVPF